MSGALEIKKEIVVAIAERITNNLKRELALQKELADDKMAMSKVGELLQKADPLPENCGYEDYSQWITGLEKEIASSTGALAKIEEQKVELEALQFYLENVS